MCVVVNIKDNDLLKLTSYLLTMYFKRDSSIVKLNICHVRDKNVLNVIFFPFFFASILSRICYVSMYLYSCNHWLVMINKGLGSANKSRKRGR